MFIATKQQENTHVWQTFCRKSSYKIFKCNNNAYHC